MILNSDSYFSIGSTHKHNDDYCADGLGNKGYTQFAVVSDGCSSSRFSDIGSRILTRCSVEPIFYAFDYLDIFQRDILHTACYAKNALNLPNQSLDATLFHLCVDNDEATENYKKYVVNAYGDGSIIKIRNDDTIEFTYIEYPSGAPLYMNYYLNPTQFEGFKQTYGLERKIYRYTITNNVVVDFTVDVDHNGKPYSEKGSCDNYKAILVTSDGVGSFINKNTNHIESTLVIRSLVDFKSYKGEFIQRRMNGFNIYCEKEGWKHTDDFSIAGIHISNV